MAKKVNAKGVLTERVEDTKAFTEHLGKRILQKKQEETAFYESSRFSEITDIIKREKYICQEELKYNSDAVKNLTYDEFTKYCNIIFEKNQNEIIFNKEKQVGELLYEDIKISLVMGQGSVFFTEYEYN